MSDIRAFAPSNPRPLVWDVAALVLPIVGLAPMLVLQTLQVWSNPQTMLLPICWLALAVLVYYEPKEVSNVRWRVLLSYLALVLAFLVGLASVIYFSPWAANLALALVFVGWALVRLASSSLSRILAMSGLILVSLSLPFGLQSRVASWTNSLVVRLCSSVLDLFNVFHLYQSPYLALKDHYFEIPELMGNVFSLETMVAIAILVSLIWKRPFLTTALNIVSALVWTVLGKIIFLFTTAVCSFNGINITESILGSVILGGIFLVFLLLLLMSDAFWNAVLLPIRAGDDARYQSATADWFNRAVTWPGKKESEERVGRLAKPVRVGAVLTVKPAIAIVFGVLIALLMFPTALAIAKNDLLLNRANYLAIPLEKIPDAKSLPDDFIPKHRLRQFRVVSGSGLSGGTTKTLFWNFGGSGVETIIFLRFPVRGWMGDTLNLFEGWKLIDSKMMNDASDWPWTESTFEEENGRMGLFLSSQLRTEGAFYKPTEEEILVASKSVAERGRLFDPVIFRMLNPKQEVLKPQSFLIQMRFQSETTIGPSERKILLEKFHEARRIFANRLTGTAPAASTSP